MVSGDNQKRLVPSLQSTFRLCFEVTGLLIIGLYGSALFFKDSATFLAITAILAPLVAAGIAIYGVLLTLRENRAVHWWERSQWVIQLLMEVEDEREFKPLGPILQHILIVDPPSAQQEELIHAVLEDARHRIWGDQWET